MKLRTIVFASIASAAFAVSSYGSIIVSDTWADGSRAEQNLPTESQWFLGGAGTLAPLGAGGPLRGDLLSGGTGSASWTTYFAADASPVTLANIGDVLKVTWQFSVTGLGAANTSQNFRLALVDTPLANRLTVDGAPGSATYGGYGMFMNMSSGTLGNASPFSLMERTSATTTSALLSAGASWTSRGNGATVGATGYVESQLYTYVMQLTLTASGVDILSTMSGGSFNNTGLASVSYSDTTPSSLTYDTFSIRPSSATGAAQIFDTSLFQVEFTAVPEPATFALAGLGMLGLVLARRARR
jgi:hypothetical protein